MVMLPQEDNMQNDVLEIDEQNFSNFVAENDTSLVMFGATWCRPCKTVKPAFNKLANQTSGVRFAYCDVEEAPDRTISLGIQGVPTFVLFKNGQPVQVKTTSREQDVVNMLENMNE